MSGNRSDLRMGIEAIVLDLIRHVVGESAHVSAQLDNLTGLISAVTRSA